MSLSKISVVTGSLKGLGLETAVELSRKGHQVILSGRDASRGKKLQEDLRKSGLELDFLPMDVADRKSIEGFTAAVLKKYGRIDVLVNNAGILIDNDVSLRTLEDFEKLLETTFRTNTLAPFLLCQAIVPGMVENGYGRVVNVSSGLGQLNDMEGGYPSYSISKTALNAVTRIFAHEGRGRNVLVNSVCPGWVRTDMGGPNAQRSVEEGADTIVWLATLPEGAPSGGFYRDRKEIPW